MTVTKRCPLVLKANYGKDNLGPSSVRLHPRIVVIIPVSHQLFVATSSIALPGGYQAEADDVSVSVLVLVDVDC